jgi:hypothetical protein
MALSERVQRMIDSAPTYYQYAQVYQEVQNAIGSEVDLVDQSNTDLQNQLYIAKATWGLTYWENALGITTNEADSYDIRRSRVLSKWRGFGNFSAALVDTVAAAYSGGEVEVTVDIPNYVVHIKFIGARGVPPNLDDLLAQLDNIIHAHLELTYEYTYITWGEVDQANYTWADVDAVNMTWEQWEKHRPQ